tara:strand:- start:916 stop:1827 length:912 start_codon:yes stop_codon:yes gene_type:complete
MAVFGLLGFAISHLVNEETIARRTPWITAIMGLFLIPYGLSLLFEKAPKWSPFRGQSGPKSAETLSVISFGISYAIVSVGCSAPLFLLQIVGSFNREGIIEGTAIFFAYALGLGAVVTSLTLSLAIARGGLVRNLRKILPYIDQFGAVTLMTGGAYLFVYGIYEIRTLNSPGTASNSIIDTVTELQSHLMIWISEVGGLEIGLALWLIIMTFVTWGLSPALTKKTRTTLRFVSLGIWILIEGLFFHGDLLVRPFSTLATEWPERINNWFEAPGRWAVPFEVLLSLMFVLVLFFGISGLLKKNK